MADLSGTRVGLIGLGHMGKPMARHLHAAGARVTVTSRSRGPVDELAAEGMTAANTPRAVAEASDIVIVMVTNTDAVDAVLHGPDGVIAGLGKGSGKLVVDMGTTKVRETREWAAEVTEAGADWLDAPVRRVTGADVPMPYAANLEKLALPQTEHIVEAAKAVCYR